MIRRIHSLLAPRIAAAAFAAGLAMFGNAQAQAMSPVGQACYEQATTNAQMMACAGAEYERQEVALNRMVGKVKEELAVADKRRLPRFEIALRRWRGWRDAECAARADLVRGGSAAPLVRLRCLASLTERQSALLKESLE